MSSEDTTVDPDEAVQTTLALDFPWIDADQLKLLGVDPTGVQRRRADYEVLSAGARLARLYLAEYGRDVWRVDRVVICNHPTPIVDAPKAETAPNGGSSGVAPTAASGASTTTSTTYPLSAEERARLANEHKHEASEEGMVEVGRDLLDGGGSWALFAKELSASELRVQVSIAKADGGQTVRRRTRIGSRGFREPPLQISGGSAGDRWLWFGAGHPAIATVHAVRNDGSEVMVPLLESRAFDRRWFAFAVRREASPKELVGRDDAGREVARADLPLAAG